MCLLVHRKFALKLNFCTKIKNLRQSKTNFCSSRIRYTPRSPRSPSPMSPELGPTGTGNETFYDSSNPPLQNANANSNNNIISQPSKRPPLLLSKGNAQVTVLPQTPLDLSLQPKQKPSTAPKISSARNKLHTSPKRSILRIPENIEIDNFDNDEYNYDRKHICIHSRPHAHLCLFKRFNYEIILCFESTVE